LFLIKFFYEEEVMSLDKPKHVLLMVPGSIEILELADGGEAEPQVLKDAVRELAIERRVDPEKLRLNIEQSMSQVSEIFSTAEQKVGELWEIQSVSVGLSINAEGSVGIATAGLKASLQVTLTPRKKTEELGF
jgi:hypothetical protein